MRRCGVPKSMSSPGSGGERLRSVGEDEVGGVERSSSYTIDAEDRSCCGMATGRASGCGAAGSADVLSLVERLC